MSEQTILPTHSACSTHAGYRMTCAEYDALLALAPGHCHCCGARTDDLVIDHDHDLGQWAVRGLICASCNRRMGIIDAARRIQNERTDRYLLTPWHASQPASKGKKRRARPRIECPVCGHSCAMRRDGKPTYHWSRLPHRPPIMCPGSD